MAEEGDRREVAGLQEGEDAALDLGGAAGEREVRRGAGPDHGGVGGRGVGRGAERLGRRPAAGRGLAGWCQEQWGVWRGEVGPGPTCGRDYSGRLPQGGGTQQHATDSVFQCLEKNTIPSRPVTGTHIKAAVACPSSASGP